MITKSPAEPRWSRDRPAGARSGETRQDVRVRSVGVPRSRIGGDTDALDWRSDPRLLAILARGVQREREAREKDQLPRRHDALVQPALASSPRPRPTPIHIRRSGMSVRTDSMITAVLEGGPLDGRRVDANIVEGRPAKTIDVPADDGTTCRYCLAEWVQSGQSAAYSFLYRV